MIGILGLGAVGSQLLQRLNTSIPQIHLFVSGPDRKKVSHLMNRKNLINFCDNNERLEDQNIQLLVISSSSGNHLQTAQRAIKNGISVISTSNKVSDVVGLLKLEDSANENDAMIVAGSAFAQG